MTAIARAHAMELFDNLAAMASHKMWTSTLGHSRRHHVLHVGPPTTQLLRLPVPIDQQLLVAALVARVPLAFYVCRERQTFEWTPRVLEDYDLVVALHVNFQARAVPDALWNLLYFVFSSGMGLGTFESRVPASDWNIVGPEVFDA